MSWQTFPWGMLGAIAAIIGLVVGLCKLAALFGRAGQRLDDLEADSHAAADTVETLVDEKVEARWTSAESQAAQTRQNLRRCMANVRLLARQVGPVVGRCQDQHGPFSQVTPIEEIDEPLRLDPPEGEDR